MFNSFVEADALCDNEIEIKKFAGEESVRRQGPGEDPRMIFLSPGTLPANSHPASPAEDAPHDRGTAGVPQAISFSVAQRECLGKFHAALLRMEQLAQRAQETSEPVRRNDVAEFRALAAQLTALIAEARGGLPLFDRQTLCVDLGEDGNQLVLASVHLRAQPYLDVMASTVDQPALAAQALRAVQIALNQLAVDGSILQANLDRLFLHGRPLDGFKEDLGDSAVSAAAADGSPPGQWGNHAKSAASVSEWPLAGSAAAPEGIAC